MGKLKILALDPATKMGWAYYDGNSTVSGTWDLSVRRDESAGMRLIRLKSKLNEIHKLGIDVLVYEGARHGAPKMQGALVTQSQLQGVFVCWAEENSIQYRAYSPSEIKKKATDKGNASKEEVMEACKKKLGVVPNDDNEADALWLLQLASDEYNNAV